jgi:predicted acylesterase/phospholipase RssA
MNSKIKTIAQVLALTASKANADKCYALALSSGDQSAAYQAGVLSGIFAAQSSELSAYSAISGMSGGAVNASILGSYDLGNESLAAERMITFWQNSSNNKLYKDWLGGIVQGLTMEGGLYNNALLKAFLTKELVDIGPMTRFVDIGITDVLTGKY